MRVLWASKAWDQYVASSDIQSRDPFKGLGQPEPLKGSLQGWWSRRINMEDRLVYRVAGKDDQKMVEIAQCKYHY
jgi:toxin YoeB